MVLNVTLKLFFFPTELQEHLVSHFSLLTRMYFAGIPWSLPQEWTATSVSGGEQCQLKTPSRRVDKCADSSGKSPGKGRPSRPSAMPFGLKLRRTRRYNVLSKNCFVTRIRLLDSNVIECTLSVESTGQECLEAVAQRLELREVRVARERPSVTG